MADDTSKVQLAEAVKTLKEAVDASGKEDPNVHNLINVSELSRASSILMNEVA
jgi:hypothetical protein